MSEYEFEFELEHVYDGKLFLQPMWVRNSPFLDALASLRPMIAWISTESIRIQRLSGQDSVVIH